ILGMEVDEANDFKLDPEGFEPMASEVREWLLQDAARTLGEPDNYGRTPGLSEDTLDHLVHLVARLDIEVFVSANPRDPRRPLMGIAFDGRSVMPADILQEDESSFLGEPRVSIGAHE
ncbi:MAG: hypothetical protein QGD91_05785, partial [Actinomycetota bacterium]|nr:hypothetical protein [Actinomycetota bacterium]